MPEGTWEPTSPFGPRVHPITGEQPFHTGSNFSVPDGTPILAAADGTVTIAEFSGGCGGLVVIEHRIHGKTMAIAYVHAWEDGINVAPGDTVRAGQHIADVGSSGMSTGPHLHFEVRDGGTDGEYIDPAKWLNDHDAADLDESDVIPPGQDDDCDTAPTAERRVMRPRRRATRASWWTTPRAMGRSRYGCAASTNRPSPDSRSRRGRATRPAPAASPSTR